MKSQQKNMPHQLYIELIRLEKEIISSKLKLLIILVGRNASGKWDN